MELTPGYKQTEVGVIPEDWDIRNLGKICQFSTGSGLLKGEFSSSGAIPAIPYTSLYTDFTEIVDYESIKWFVDEASKTRLVDFPCVLIASSSNMEINTGKASALTKSIPVAIGREVIILKSNCDCAYISYLLSTEPYRKRTLTLARGTTIKHVYTATFYEYPIALPTKAEQEAIAEALSDVDALIESLEQLITKKRQITQGAMQELLIGKRRLPGFNGKWRERTLGELFEVSAGGDLNKPCFSPVKTGDYCHPIFANSVTNDGLYGFSSEYRYEAEAITVTARGTLGIAKYRPMRFDAIGRLLVLRPRLQIDCQFAAQFISNRVQFAVESTGVPQLTAPQISKYSVSCPALDEQQAIAKVLSDMDTEISASVRSLYMALLICSVV